MPSENFIDRRSFLKKITAGVAGAALAGVPQFLNRDHSEIEDTEENSAIAISEVNKEHPYQTGPLAGHHFDSDSLFHHFTGISGKVPEEININFKDQLVYLVEMKKKWMHRHNKTKPEALHTMRTLLGEYEKDSPGRKNFDAYQHEVQSSIQDVHTHIDWTKVEKIMDLEPAQASLLQAITNSLKAKNLTAYAMTELMPSDDGTLNKNVFDFILKNGGERYVYSIPSIYDGEISFGPYQFTPYALLDHGHHTAVAASQVNYALPKDKRIPGTVEKLRGSEHHVAALLFSIYNLSTLIKQLDRKQFQTLQTTWKHNTVSINQFIATAHHMPTPALRAAKEWLDGGAHHTFEKSCPKNIHGYALKTKSNLSAL